MIHCPERLKSRQVHYPCEGGASVPKYNFAFIMDVSFRMENMSTYNHRV